MKLTRRGLFGTVMAALAAPKLAAVPVSAQNVTIPITKRPGLRAPVFNHASYSLGWTVNPEVSDPDQVRLLEGYCVRLAERQRQREEELVRQIFYSNT